MREEDNAARTIQKSWKVKRKRQDTKEDRAARTIQTSWKVKKKRK
jgi:hypothetical protein